MKFIKSFNDGDTYVNEEPIVEKSIGSESIRDKYYADIPKKKFYEITKIDPTSIRKKDFSKPGKYSKWLLNQYKKGNMNDLELDYINRLNYCLFIFSTGWYRTRSKKSSYSLGGRTYRTIENDINIFKTIDQFVKYLSSDISEYEKMTEKSKYDVIYSNENIDVLVPLNFSGSYETAKNTEWCSQSLHGYSMWNSMAIMFRIIPKRSEFDKLKLTWSKGNRYWYLACSKYPEISGPGTPFDLSEDGQEIWKTILSSEMDGEGVGTRWYENGRKIKSTMSLMSKRAKSLIVEYYKTYQDKRNETY